MPSMRWVLAITASSRCGRIEAFSKCFAIFAAVKNLVDYEVR